MTTCGVSILVVDDDLDVRDSIMDVLADEGYIVTGATDGIDALEHLRTCAALPQLIFLDLMMPRMNGIEFCTEVRAVAEWSAIPIVIVTADGTAKPRVELLSIHGFLKKPVRLEDLIRTAQSVLAR